VTGRTLLILSYDFPPSTGGIARLCSEIAQGMVDYYNKVVVLTVGEESASSKVTYEIVRFAGIRPWIDLKIIKYLRKLENKDNIDLICGLWYPDGLLAILGGFSKCTVLAHGAELRPGNSWFRKIIWLPVLGKWVLGRVNNVVSNSAYTAKLALALNNTAKVQALPLAVDHNRFFPNKKRQGDDKFVIITVARILKFKGHDTILNALELLPSNFQEKIIWRIAGTGPYAKQFECHVANSTFLGKIEFHGFVSDSELPRFYNQADLFVLVTEETESSNQVEGFGMVFLEAQASGVPVIGSRTGGIPDAIKEGNGGYLVRQKDPNALSECIFEFINSPEKCLKQSNLARERVIHDATFNSYNQKLNNILKAL